MFATRAVASVDPKTVAALLGHSTVVMTLQIYAHTERERQRKALFGVLETIPRQIGGQKVVRAGNPGPDLLCPGAGGRRRT
ncbi:hypothetical protein [Thermus tengchongensis]|uniref:hypothetical protein n=1 Tax=Thermus tengchongensis TaxID=1214928 RepID=UPI0039B74C00